MGAVFYIIETTQFNKFWVPSEYLSLKILSIFLEPFFFYIEKYP